MKCLLCEAEIDECKEFPPSAGPQGQLVDDVVGRWRHAQLLSAWTQLSLTAQTAGGVKSLLAGHVCPDHILKPGTVGLVAIQPKEGKGKS